MRDGAQPVPEPLGRRGAQHDLATGARYVDGRAFGIVEREAVQWAVAAIAADSPLIFIDGRGGYNIRWPGNPRDDIEGDRLGVRDVETPDTGTLSEIDHRVRQRRTPQSQHECT